MVKFSWSYHFAHRNCCTFTWSGFLQWLHPFTLSHLEFWQFFKDSIKLLWKVLRQVLITGVIQNSSALLADISFDIVWKCVGLGLASSGGFHRLWSLFRAEQNKAIVALCEEIVKYKSDPNQITSMSHGISGYLLLHLGFCFAQKIISRIPSKYLFFMQHLA